MLTNYELSNAGGPESSFVIKIIVYCFKRKRHTHFILVKIWMQKTVQFYVCLSQNLLPQLEIICISSNKTGKWKQPIHRSLFIYIRHWRASKTSNQIQEIQNNSCLCWTFMNTTYLSVIVPKTKSRKVSVVYTSFSYRLLLYWL